MKHKNAAAAAITTGISTLAVWLARKYFGYDLDQVYGSVVAGSVVTAVLFVGRRGIRGTALALWNGGLLAWNGTERPAAKKG